MLAIEPIYRLGRTIPRSFRKNRRHSSLVRSSQEWGAKTDAFRRCYYSERQFSAANTVGSAPNLLTQSLVRIGSARQWKKRHCGARCGHIQRMACQVTGNDSRGKTSAVAKMRCRAISMNWRPSKAAQTRIIDVMRFRRVPRDAAGRPLKPQWGVNYRRKTIRIHHS